MQLLLIKEKTWDVIEGNPPNPITDEWRNKDLSAYSTIGLNIEDDQSNLIRDKKTAKEAWNALKAYHEKGSASFKVRLLKGIMTMRLEEGGDMEAHIARINDAFHRMIDSNNTINLEDWKVATLLGSLPESYDNLVTTLESRPEEDLTANVVQSRLIDEYQKRQFKTGAYDGDSAFKVTRGIRQSTCFFCHRSGHFKKDCKKYKRWLAKQSKDDKKGQKVNMVEDNEYLFMISSAHSGGDWSRFRRHVPCRFR